MSKISKAVVTKIFRTGSQPRSAGYQWCIDLVNERAQAVDYARCDSSSAAREKLDSLKSKVGYDFPIEWDDESHPTLSMAPEYIEGNCPRSEEARDAMHRRAAEYMKKKGYDERL